MADTLDSGVDGTFEEEYNKLCERYQRSITYTPVFVPSPDGYHLVITTGVQRYVELIEEPKKKARSKK